MDTIKATVGAIEGPVQATPCASTGCRLIHWSLPMKRCGKCGHTLSLSQFSKNGRNADGHACWCKQCMAVYQRAYQKTHKAQIKEYARAYRREHRAEIAAQKKTRPPTKRQENRKHCRARDKVYWAIRGHRMVRPAHCERCGAGRDRPLAHHHDYEKPLDVVFVCPQCHGDIHELLKEHPDA